MVNGSTVGQTWSSSNIPLKWQFYTPAGKAYKIFMCERDELTQKYLGYPPAWPGIPQENDSFDIAFASSPHSVESYEFIRSRLQECDASHFDCKFPPGLPTRLLDVLHEDATKVRLIETESLPAGHTATYIALSYCWGKG